MINIKYESNNYLISFLKATARYHTEYDEVIDDFNTFELMCNNAGFNVDEIDYMSYLDYCEEYKIDSLLAAGYTWEEIEEIEAYVGMGHTLDSTMTKIETSRITESKDNLILTDAQKQKIIDNTAEEPEYIDELTSLKDKSWVISNNPKDDYWNDAEAWYKDHTEEYPFNNYLLIDGKFYDALSNDFIQSIITENRFIESIDTNKSNDYNDIELPFPYKLNFSEVYSKWHIYSIHPYDLTEYSYAYTASPDEDVIDGAWKVYDYKHYNKPYLYDTVQTLNAAIELMQELDSKKEARIDKT